MGLFTTLAAMTGDDIERHDVAIDVTLTANEQGVPLLRGKAEAVVSETCQRCLESLVLPIKATVFAAFVDHEDAEADEQADLWVVDANGVNLLEVIEESVLLAMPLAPKHELSQCAAALPVEKVASTSDRETVTPFAGLKDLLADKD